MTHILEMPPDFHQGSVTSDSWLYLVLAGWNVSVAETQGWISQMKR